MIDRKKPLKRVLIYERNHSRGKKKEILNPSETYTDLPEHGYESNSSFVASSCDTTKKKTQLGILKASENRGEETIREGGRRRGSMHNLFSVDFGEGRKTSQAQRKLK